MLKAIVTVGISCSGKSTYAKELLQKEKGKWVEVNRDNVRFTVLGASTWSDYKFSHGNESLVSSVCWGQVLAAKESGKNVIVSDTNLNPKYRDKLIRDLSKEGFKVHIKDVEISLEEAWKRDSLRLNGVGPSIIYNQYQQWLDYKGIKKYHPKEGLLDAVVFDIDGTLAQMQGRTPFEWAKVYQDLPRPEIISMLKGYQLQGYSVVLASGRDGCCEDLTKLWLEEVAEVDWDDFFIRPVGNTEKDTVIKERMLWDDITPKYNVVAWVDDRPVVCRKLRELGVNVIQVADPHIEF